MLSYPQAEIVREMQEECNILPRGGAMGAYCKKKELATKSIMRTILLGRNNLREGQFEKEVIFQEESHIVLHLLLRCKTEG
jgi:hypothetical protein